MMLILKLLSVFYDPIKSAYKPIEYMPHARDVAHPLSAPVPGSYAHFKKQIKPLEIKGFRTNYGGEGGIRTLEGFDTLHDFESWTFDHSDTSPCLSFSFKKIFQNLAAFFFQNALYYLSSMIKMIVFK